MQNAEYQEAAFDSCSFIFNFLILSDAQFVLSSLSTGFQHMGFLCSIDACGQTQCEIFCENRFRVL